MPTYEKITIQFKRFILADADTSMALGDEAHLGNLGNPSLEYMLERSQQAKELLSTLQTIKGETFDEQLDLDLMARHLQQNIFFSELQQHGRPQRCSQPNGIDGISAGIFQLFVNDERSPEFRLNDILTRLQQAPYYLATETEVIAEPITRWRDIELEQGEGLPDLFQTILEWAQLENYSQLDSLKIAISECNTALDSYLSDLKNKKTHTNFAIGLDKVNELLAIRQISHSPAELTKMARDFMGKTQILLSSLKTKLCEKYGLEHDTKESELHEYLNDRFAATLKDGKLTSVLDYYYQQIESIHDFVSEKKLFTLPTEQDMKIMQTPGFLEPVIPAGAMWPPLALREGKKTSLVYLTLKEDQLAEHTELGIPVMMIHEGIPGHHLQFATAAQHPSFIRRIFSANEHAEGWTTMLEDYMLDVGYVDKELVDEVRFIAKREMSRLVARVGIDLYFMTSNKDYLNVGLDLNFESVDVFVNAAILLKAATGFTDGRVQAELNWYSSEQSYPLSYLTGNRMVWQLKEDIQKANKKALDKLALDQAFHEVYLSSGCMPVESLRSVFMNLGYL
ncbi:MAG: hypothetical protein ACJASG_002197 [Oleiphilaceae bacterium]|jgi:uncharacterized protein (DUF885 family)